MKKLLLIFIIVFFVSGCSNTSVNKDYEEDLETLENSTLSTLNYDYNVNVIYEKFDENENMYNLVLDGFPSEPNDLKVLLYHTAETNDIFPSYGYYDDSKFEGKGLNLVGYINNEQELPITFKIMVTIDEVSNIHIFTFDQE